MSLGTISLQNIPLPAALVEWRAGGKVVVNSAFRRLLENQLSPDQPPVFDHVKTLLGGRLENLKIDSEAELVAEIKIGRDRYSYEFNLKIIPEFDTTTIFILGVNKTDLLKAEAKLNSYTQIIEKNNLRLKQLAYTDSLTGAANRRALFERFAEISQSSEFHCTVSVLDIDHFKKYNDRYGHDFGDLVLKTFANLIQSQLGDEAIFARVGGEEFCVIEYSGSTKAAKQNLRNALNEARNLQIDTLKSEFVNISFSAGVAEYGKNGETLDDLLKNADLALYFAKANGRSCVIPYSVDLFEKRDTTLIARTNGRR
ncbi:MAG: GGDEF domain-containing protein [Proteobacteria bacterium]|jgi:diguanylate cyclase (GGDEF)-like protein|nr:GGDEF domain-containing protein [Pseudomonadota bacterium]|tara:strand:- start:242 stop:1180 length:939 start_codon:yes stop_codon:yes gene_type:complete